MCPCRDALAVGAGPLMRFFACRVVLGTQLEVRRQRPQQAIHLRELRFTCHKITRQDGMQYLADALEPAVVKASNELL